VKDSEMDNMEHGYMVAANALRAINALDATQITEDAAAAIIAALTAKLTRSPMAHQDHIVAAVESLDYAHEYLITQEV
jgi:hypothetical protein